MKRKDIVINAKEANKIANENYEESKTDIKNYIGYLIQDACESGRYFINYSFDDRDCHFLKQAVCDWLSSKGFKVDPLFLDLRQITISWDLK